MLSSLALVFPSLEDGFSASGNDNLRAFEVPFPLDIEGLTETEDFGVGEFESLPDFPACVRCTFFWLMDGEGTRISQGRAAIQRSFQLQPQSALPSSYLPRRLGLALHCKLCLVIVNLIHSY